VVSDGAGYAASVSTDTPASGQRCALLEIRAGVGDLHAHLSQRIDAVAWRGKEIHVRAWARREDNAAASDAAFSLVIARPEGPVGFQDQRSIDADRWSPYELRALVPDDAEALIIIFSRGDVGKLWVDGVSVEATAAH
jgi:hypothetical protein